VPIGTLPKLRLGGVAASEPGFVPLPVTAAVRVEFVAVEPMAMLPAAGPAALGANVTCSVALWPDDKVIGSVSPLRLNPEPEIVAAEMVALVPPEFVNLVVWLWLVPTVTVPKLTLDGVNASCPAVVPSPETVTAAVVGADAAED
jgi:hypothetical protein